MRRSAGDPCSEEARAQARALTLVVIGHVNHGKTALVRALTGMETDRLKAEIERGLSITLGFAWCDGPGGHVDLIDAPGHEDFIRAMVSGATGARAVLLVVSATEGFGRQTREHLRIATLLGIRAGVVAVTKADLLAPEDEDAALARIAAELRGSDLDGEPVVLCSAVSERGLTDLHAALEALAARTPLAEPLPGAFLPIDRAFTVTGTGTVVTGTLQGGTLTTGGAVVLEPSSRKASLRQIQVHGEPVEAVTPGGRVAVGLRGVASDAVKAGEVLCTPGAFRSAQQVDVEVTVAAAATRPLKPMDQVRVLWGARYDTATVRLFGDKAIAPGGRGLVQLRFAHPVIAYAGQRAILRRLSPPETFAGLVVLDPEAPVSRGRTGERSRILTAAAGGDLDGLASGLAARDGGLPSVAEISRLSRRSKGDIIRSLAASFAVLDDDRMASRRALAATREAYLGHLAEAHRLAPERASAAVGSIRDSLAQDVPRDLIALVEKALGAAGEIRLHGGEVALPGYDPFAALSPEAAQRLAGLEAELRAGGLSPPSPPILGGGGSDSEPLLDLLIASGRAVSLYNGALRQTLVFHGEALRAAFNVLRTAFPSPHEFTTGEARAALGTTRKFIVPVLEYFDAQALTMRRGDIRQVIETD